MKIKTKIVIGVYKFTSPIGKVYVGSSRDVNRRKREHKSSIKGTILSKIINSLKDFGYENHTFEMKEECEIENLNERERYWQDFYDVLGENGLNSVLTKTDSKPFVMSEESRAKSSLSHTNLLHSKEAKEKMSHIHKNRSEEHLENLRLSRKKASVETREKMSQKRKLYHQNKKNKL